MDTRQENRQAPRSSGRPAGKTGKRSRPTPGPAAKEGRPAQRPAGTAPRRKPAGEAVKKATGRAATASQRREAPAKERRPRRRSEAPAKERRPRQNQGLPQQSSGPAPEVVYTPARPFNRNRFLIQLATIVAVVLALSFGMSVFFKVETITVSGTDKYDPWIVKEASGIEIGDNLLSFGEAKAAGKIKTALPYVESVRIGIKLPDTVNIEIKELDVVYAIKDADGFTWWLITAEGRVVDKVNSAEAGEWAEVRGVTLANPVVGMNAVAQEPVHPTEDATSETAAPVTVRASDQLHTALTILQYLEDCGIIGQVTSVDVTDLGNLELEYGQRFRVKLGDTTQLLYKIRCMNAAINGKDKENALKDYDSGVLDISFTIKPNQVIYQSDED